MASQETPTHSHFASKDGGSRFVKERCAVDILGMKETVENLRNSASGLVFSWNPFCLFGRILIVYIDMSL